MRATPSQGLAHTVWFLLARDGTSTIRITPGLTLREDADGDIQVLKPGAAGGWLRFDLQGSALFAQVVSDEWTLATGPRQLGERLRLDSTLELVLPNHVFQISENLGGPGRANCPEVRLVARPVEPAAAMPAAREGQDRVQPSRRTRADSPPPSRVEAPPRIRVDAPPQRPAAAPDRPAAPTCAMPVEPVESVTPPAERVPTPAQETGTGAPDVRPSTHRARARPEILIRTPAAPHRGRQRRRRNRVPPYGAFAAPVLLVALALFSPSALTPVSDDDGQAVAGSPEALTMAPAARPSNSRLPNAGDDPLQTQVEALLAGAADDRATLQFAVESYRLVQRRRPGDAHVAARLRELETQLDSAPP